MLKIGNKKRLLGRALILCMMGIVFGYLHSRGLSPVSVALLFVCYRGFLRMLYAVASIVVTAALIFVILSYLIY